MNIEELIAKVKERDANRTPAERRALLIKAKILDENGDFDSKFFREETVAAGKRDFASSES